MRFARVVFILALVFQIRATPVLGHGDDAPAGVGTDKAVLQVDHHKGFRLAPKAIQALGLKFRKVTGKTVPHESMVFHRDEVGVYRVREGWIQLVEIPDLKPGDEIVIAGVSLLRVTELDVMAEEEGEHHD